MSLELSKTLLNALRCPETKQALALADEVTLARVNQAIAKGGVKNIGGETITETIGSALIREDQKRLYQITDGFPIMLIDESIDLEKSDSDSD